jgi:CRISPR/Cas system-associated exonuclease Cas4 (RecB family)
MQRAIRKRIRFPQTPVDFSYDDLEASTLSSGRVYTTPTNVKYPSVTTVMSRLSKDGIMEWRARVGEEEANRVMRLASGRGTIVHDLMEKYVRGDEIDETDMMPHHRKSYHGLADILDERLTEWYVQEKAMWSDHLGVAGRVDLVGRFDGVRTIIDFKTSLKPKRKEWISNYFMQSAAYSIMYEERTGVSIPNIVIVMDIDGHEPIVFKEHRDNWVKQLQQAIADYHREERCKVHL